MVLAQQASARDAARRETRWPGTRSQSRRSSPARGACCPISWTTHARAASSPGKRRRALWTDFRAGAASTSPTRPSTGTRRARAEHTALRCLGKPGARRDLTYAELAALTNRFANVLGALGVEAGERVFALCGRIPELYVAALGTLQGGPRLLSPLLGLRARADPPAARARDGPRARHDATPSTQRKVAGLRAALPALEHVLLAGDGDAGAARAAARNARLAALLARRGRALRDPARRTRRIRRSCTSRAAPPARRRAPCTCTAPSSRTTPPARSRSTSTRTTSSGARRTPAG